MPDLEHWPASHLFSTAARLFERASAEALRPLGVSHAEAVALRILAATGPCTQSELAAAVGIRAQSLGETLVKLHARNCVNLERTGRVQHVSMTPNGARVLELVIEAEDEIMGRALLDERFCEVLQLLVRTQSGDSLGSE